MTGTFAHVFTAGQADELAMRRTTRENRDDRSWRRACYPTSTLKAGKTARGVGAGSVSQGMLKTKVAAGLSA